ncbi:MAG: hypothetical protein EOP82_09350 [Variovorax sp.]|nr:MAG: hypothetical protein EOP82_09350 [Variovorax sp.]
MITRRSAFILATALFALQRAQGSAFAAISPVLAPGAHASGGISYEGQQEMQAKQDLYTLRLAFAEAQTGAYVAGVTVTIEAEGRNAPFGPFADCGPLFYVALRPGVYRVIASYAGLTRTKAIRVGRGATHVTLYWPAVNEH